jgi:NAD+ kinase
MTTAARGARVCVVLKRTSWRRWVDEEHDERTHELLAAGDEVVGRMRASHADHMQTIAELQAALAELDAAATWHERPHEFHAPPDAELVVVVGGDGTLLAASHGVGPNVPLLGVNSAPGYSVGFFCGASKGNVGQALAAALAGSLRATELSRMRVTLNGDPLHDRVLNEALFCHACPAATSRYILRVLDGTAVRAEEDQTSSGVWVGPAAGSTAAQRSAGGQVLPLTSSELQYVVREPYRPYDEVLNMTIGRVAESQSLAIKSRMHKAALFLDGEHIVHHVAIGDVVTLHRSAEALRVLGLSRNGAPDHGVA